MSPKKPFWSEGIRFECQGTGQCCLSRGSYGYVYLTLEDRRRIARHLGMSTLSFTRQYCEKADGYFRLKEIGTACRFLDGKRCGVYPARPAQCRTWPFWPENMNPRAWDKDVKAFCPGVGKGKLYSPDEIQALLKQDPIESGA